MTLPVMVAVEAVVVYNCPLVDDFLDKSCVHFKDKTTVTKLKNEKQLKKIHLKLNSKIKQQESRNKNIRFGQEKYPSNNQTNGKVFIIFIKEH